MPIHVLDSATVGMISAGEVVERPASAAKELIENALDAGATAVTIDVRDGGNSYLRITDNGCGIPANEVRIAFENHATSKIKSGNDISGITTLGFRGEALPSIAAVSKVEMTTRRKGTDTGMRIRIEGGSVVSLDEAGCPEGTTVIMRDIFFNTPVRRAFLKKGAYEFGVISDTVARMILGNPGVAFKLLNNGKTVYHSFGDGQLKHAVLAVYGRETAEHMIEIDESEGAFRLSGVIGVGEQAKATRSHQAFFINGRSVRCPVIQRALEEAVRGRVMIGLYPMCALSITLSPSNVDVNVHPNKLEVRFRDDASVKETIDALFARALKTDAILTPDVKNAPEAVAPVKSVKTVTHSDEGMQQSLFGIPAKLPFESQSGIQVLREEGLAQTPQKIVFHDVAPVNPAEKPMPVAAEVPKPHMPDPVPPQAPPVVQLKQKIEESPKSETKALPPYRIVGVLFNTYIVLEFQDTVLLIDQHAAHERLRFEQYKRLLDTGCAAQQLLTPMVLHLTAREIALLENNLATLKECGYDIEPFGDRSIRVLSVPHILGRAEMQPLFMDMIDSLGEMKTAARDSRIVEIMQMSCKHAVKGGDVLSTAEINALLQEMTATGAPPTCPHGRPIFKRLTRRDLEHMFHRIQ